MIIRGGISLKGDVKINPSAQESLYALGMGLIFREQLRLENLSQSRMVLDMLNLLNQFGVKTPTAGQKMGYIEPKDSSSLLSFSQNYLYQPLFLILPGMILFHSNVRLRNPGKFLLNSPFLKPTFNLLSEFGISCVSQDDYISLSFSKENLKRIISLDERSSYLSALCLLLCAAFVKDDISISGLKIDAENARLLDFLNKNIFQVDTGSTSETLTFKYKSSQEACVYKVQHDPFEIGLFSVAGLLTEGEVTCRNICSKDYLPFLSILEKMGHGFEITDNSLVIWRDRKDPVHPEIFENTLTSPFFSSIWDPLLCLLISKFYVTGILKTSYVADSAAWLRDFRPLGLRVRTDGSPEDSYKISGLLSLNGRGVNFPPNIYAPCLLLCLLASSGRSQVSGQDNLDLFHTELLDRFISLGAVVEAS